MLTSTTLLTGRWPAAMQAHLDLVGRRPDRDAADPAADEARAQRRLLDLDRQALLDGRRPVSTRVGLGEADRRPGHGGDLAGQADDAQRVAAVRLDVDIEHDVAVQVGQRDAERRRRAAG